MIICDRYVAHAHRQSVLVCPCGRYNSISFICWLGNPHFFSFSYQSKQCSTCLTVCPTSKSTMLGRTPGFAVQVLQIVFQSHQLPPVCSPKTNLSGPSFLSAIRATWTSAGARLRDHIKAGRSTLKPHTTTTVRKIARVAKGHTGGESRGC